MTPQNEIWYRDYAKKVLEIKGRTSATQSQIDNLLKRLKAAFTKSYHCVALDIDGTITEIGSLEIDQAVISPLWRIIAEHVNVILTTGRGRPGARKIGETLRKILLQFDSSLSNLIFRRLHCITHNGAFLLSSTTELDIDFLQHESELAVGPNFLDTLEELCAERINKKFGEEVKVTKEPVGIRIKPNNRSFHKTDSLCKISIELFNSMQEDWKKKISLVKGIYGDSEVIEFTSVNKGIALRKVGKILGIHPSSILRIGDQGQKGYNDYEFLNSTCGFSVGGVSSNLNACFPVLERDSLEPIKGAKGTEALLEVIHPTPAIALRSPDTRLYSSRLLRFEQLARARARTEQAWWISILSSRIKQLKTDEELPNNYIPYGEIIDHHSGAMKFREWDWNSIENSHPLKHLFSTYEEKRFKANSKKSLYYSMYTDTARILRGPFYYYPLAFDGKERYLGEYLDDCHEFVRKSERELEKICPHSLDDHRLLLGVMDNIRNILIVTGFGIFRLAQMGLIDVPNAHPSLINHYQILVQHTNFHISELIDPFPDVFRIQKYRVHLAAVRKTIDEATKAFRKHRDHLTTPNDLFRRWREADNFLENIFAVQVALHEFAGKIPQIYEKPTIVHGVAYGGFELPAICVSIGERLGIKVIPAMTCYQVYKARQKAGVRNTIKRLTDFHLFGDRNLRTKACIHLLADDNVTTGRTLHLVRDRFEQEGKHVSGIIIVRYPGENRLVQMQMSGHGCPDTDIFYTYIQGLIAPAPYTRIVKEGPPGSEYLDETGIFDKSRHRVCRYLYRNGLYNSNDVKSHARKLARRKG